MAEVIDGILIGEVETKNIMTKSSLPVGGYSVNPYVGCTHACKYSFICGKGYSPPFGGRIAFCLQSAKSFVRFLHHLRLIK